MADRDPKRPVANSRFAACTGVYQRTYLARPCGPAGISLIAKEDAKSRSIVRVIAKATWLRPQAMFAQSRFVLELAWLSH